MKMFCYQCEQTAQCKGCTSFGICGKDPTTANLQDVLLHVTKGVSQYAHRARLLGAKDEEIDRRVIENLFTTVTNVNFDANRIITLIHETVKLREKAKKLYSDAAKKAGISEDHLTGAANFKPAEKVEELEAQAKEVGIEARKQKFGEDITGLMELLTYGVKGMAAYADHALILGEKDDEIFAFIHKALDLLTHEHLTIETLYNANMECGKVNLKTMELLDSANTKAYGHPEPTKIRITPKKGKAILVSGHDLRDLYELLVQTENTGINVYTHGEMLPCNTYPAFKRFKHLVGNYGGAWQDQANEFEAFPGSILMTTNCIQKPKDSYKHRIFTSGLVGWPGVKHIPDRNFQPVIEAALKEPGFTSDEPEKFIWGGFARNAVLSVADKVINLIKSGKIKHIFLIGGCDGAKTGRNYYTEFAQSVPSDCLILTLACGKYRFNKLEFGDIDGIPRLLDVGQCNDAYSAIQIAIALSKAFNTDVNSLPLSLILSWYEQKAVCILLTLLSLEIKNIRLGPSLPAFITPNLLNVLVEKFSIKPITTAKEDLKSILPNHPSLTK